MPVIKNKGFIYYGLGEKLVRLREGKHLQQKDIATYLGVTPQSVSGYEDDTATPSLEVFSDLCAFYNVSADYLLGFNQKQTLLVDGLSNEEIGLISGLISALKAHHKNEE